jgi:hypothetical protein
VAKFRVRFSALAKANARDTSSSRTELMASASDWASIRLELC